MYDENENNSSQRNEDDIMNNEGEEEENIIDNSQKRDMNKYNNLGNYNSEDPNRIDTPSNKIKDNQKKYQMKKKFKRHSTYEEKRGKNNNDGIFGTDELFKKAKEKNLNKGYSLIELDNEGNTLSTKITEVLYDKCVGQNIQK